MKPEQGLFQFDFDDYHAVLGVPITADTKTVRKRYLTIARKLHPDSLSEAPADEARQASDILSKLVNPAYEALSQEKSSTEHLLVLKLKGQSLRQSGSPPAVSSAAAQELIKASYAEAAYRQAVNGLAARQFDQFDAVTSIMGELSELNLVYLYRSSVRDDTSARSGTAPARPQSTPASASAKPGQATAPSPRQAQSAILESYINRAQEYEYNQDYSRAILELREAVKAYPTNGPCHSYLSTLYLKAGQATMARIHAKRALEINPNDEKALAVQARVDKAVTGSTSGAAKGTGPKASNPKSSDQGGGFFGLFGGKKKS
jgi:curved DNA-binding protein CbpA